MTRYVLFHSGCFDGFTSAWAAHKALGDTDTKYLPVNYGDDFPEIEDGSIVYMLDFSCSRDRMFSLLQHNTVILLDHHKTALEDLGDIEDVNLISILDMKRSGAGITWDYFRRVLGQRSKLVNYVEDRDLWNWLLPNAKEIDIYIRSHKRTFDGWTELESYLENFFDDAVAVGRQILMFQEQVLSQIMSNVQDYELDGYKIKIVNCSCFQSEVGNELLERFPEIPFAAYYFDKGNDKRIWGLRSRGDFDVSAIARNHGGGGHAAASGFVEKRSEKNK